jgi:hypothetical protein
MSAGKVAEGLAAYGRVKSYASTAVIVLISLCVFVLGVVWARSSAKDQHTSPVTATLKNVTCQTNVNTTQDKAGNVTKHESVTCIGDATYSVGGTSYIAQRLSFPTKYDEGQQVTIFINPVNPNDVVSVKPAPAYVGGLLASGACVVGIVAVGWSYLMSKSDVLATVEGTREAAGDIRGLFRGGSHYIDYADDVW